MLVIFSHKDGIADHLGGVTHGVKGIVSWSSAFRFPVCPQQLVIGDGHNNLCPREPRSVKVRERQVISFAPRGLFGFGKFGFRSIQGGALAFLSARRDFRMYSRSGPAPERRYIPKGWHRKRPVKLRRLMAR